MIPPITNAIRAVITGTTSPPARCIRSYRAAIVSGGAAPSGSGALSGATGSVTLRPPSCHCLLPLRSEHLEADFLRARSGRMLRDDLPLVDHEDPVGESEDLFQLERHQQD